MSHDKTHFAVCVKGYRPSEETLRKPNQQPPPKTKKGNNFSMGSEPEDTTFDAAVIIYKLPWMEHGNPNPDKKANLRKPEIQGNTAVVEADTEVTLPKRVRTVLHRVTLEGEVSPGLGNCSFSHGKQQQAVQRRAKEADILVCK